MKINNIALAIAGLLVLGLYSCKEVHEYEPAAKETGSQVFFAANLPSSYNLKEVKDSTFSFSVARFDSTSAVTVNMSYSIFNDTIDVTKSGLFTCPEEVSFEAGKRESTVQVKFAPSKLSEGVDYSFKFVIADETTSYGSSSYSFTASIPAAWTKWKKVNVTEGWWGEEETEYLYYQDKGDGKYYCYIENCFDTEGGAEPTNFYFTWNQETNMIDVERQYMGWEYDAGQPVYFYDWYNYCITDGGYAGSWADADEFYSKNGDSYPRSYYDENGGFYFNLKYHIPGVGGWTPDPFDMVAIAEGFVRTTDYNDEKHLGASAPLVTGNVQSMFFSSDGATPVEFESGLRYSDNEKDTVETVYYLPNYFGAGKEGKCLAFKAPVPENLIEGSIITDVDNEQQTGVKFMGNDIYVKVKTGLVSLNVIEGDTFPAFDITLKVFAMDTAGVVTYDFGEVEESFTGYEVLNDRYTMDDLYGGYYSDYLGTWNMTGTFESQSGFAEKSYDVEFLEDVNDSSFKIVNLSSYKSAFADTVIANYNSSYGILEVHPQALNAKYSGYDVSLGLLDFDSGYWYDSTQVTIYGGICTDGNFAFVNAYTGYNICGFYYYVVTGPSSESGLLGVYYVYGSYAGASSAPKYAAPRTDYVTAIPAVKSALRGGKNIGKTVLSRNSANCVEKAAINRPTFNLQPIEKADNRKEIECPSINVIR